MKKLALAFLLAAGLLCASPITETVKLVDVGHPPLGDGHYYVGPYDLLINGETWPLFVLILPTAPMLDRVGLHI